MYTYTSDSLKVLHEVVVELDAELLCDELSCCGESWWRLRSGRVNVVVTDICSMFCFGGDASYGLSLPVPDILDGDALDE